MSPQRREHLVQRHMLVQEQKNEEDDLDAFLLEDSTHNDLSRDEFRML